MKRTIVAGLIVFSLILLPNLTHAQSVKDRVLGLFRYFQGNGLAAVKKAPSTTNGTLAPLSGDGIVYSSDALYTWSGTNPETLLITQGTVTFTTNTFSFHPNLIVSVSGGNVLFQVSNSLNTLNLNGGSATLATGTNNVLTTKSLSITGSSYLDITNGGVIVDYSGSPTTLLTTIKGYITSARGCLDICDPSWSGLGIRSSSAAVATPDRDLVAVGYADNANLEIHGPYTTFMGQTLPDSTVILIRFTQSGDTDLDGKVGDNDVTILGAYYAPLVSNRHFYQGDADYTGKVGDSDVTLLGAQYDEFVQTSNLVAQANTTSVTLYWDKFVNYSGNTTILKQIGGGAQFQLTTTPNSTLTDSAVTPGTIYTYQVKGTNGHLSNLIQVKVPATSQVPNAPSNLVATAVSSTQINLAWTDNATNEQWFNLERKQGTGGYAAIASPFQDATSYPNTNLTSGTTYTYRIKAHNASGDSTYSNEASATTQNTSCGNLCVPALSSKPGAPVTIYLDFDGDPATTWGTSNVPATPAYDVPVYDAGTGTLIGDPTTFSSTELANINEIWKRTSEKFSSFNVNITTVDPVSYPDRGALQIVIGGDGSWAPGYPTITLGGESVRGSFYDGSTSSNQVYVFSKNTSYGDPLFTAEEIAHQAGGALGLYYQSVYNSAGTRTDLYNYGTSMIGPIMGHSYNSVRGLWWSGTSQQVTYDFPTATWIPVPQDDMAVITTSSFSGITYRPDDFGNTIQTASPLTVSGTTRTKSGIIEKITNNVSDADYFSFTTAGGSVTLRVDPAQYGPMLDPKITLYNSSGTQVAQADASYIDRFHPYPGDIITTNLSAGTYYISIQGHGILSAGVNGSGNDLGKGMDVGQYTVTVTGP
jgi:hypothetical protein